MTIETNKRVIFHVDEPKYLIMQLFSSADIGKIIKCILTLGFCDPVWKVTYVLVVYALTLTKHTKSKSGNVFIIFSVLPRFHDIDIVVLKYM